MPATISSHRSVIAAPGIPHESSPVKLQAGVRSPRSTVSAPAGATSLRKILDEQTEEMEAAGFVPKGPVSYAKSLTLQDFNVPSPVAARQERDADETASTSCLPSTSKKGSFPEKSVTATSRVVGRGGGIRIRATSAF